uniref:Drosophila melanogaster acetylcholinesterase (AChE) n=1 Tax=Drosophila melanogaster TaxID=7227 RepID=A2NUE9_DROME|nr:unnamed protein product [Drosophila melanogaster]
MQAALHFIYSLENWQIRESESFKHQT